jgi:tRNA-splicing ligase RtcB (3'-phosphate/5'-hydroxy nucleic acid ligase)
MKNLITRTGNHEIAKEGEFKYVIKKNESKGMIVPVTIYADDNLVSKMALDRTIDQAANVATLRGVMKHVVVLPDGHEGYGFPVGGVAGMDLEEGVISPGGVGYDINCGVRLIRTNLREKEIRPKLRDLVNQLFHAIPSGVGSSSPRKVTRSEMDELLVQGVRWTVHNGYGWDSDVDVCEENGCMKGADPVHVSELARKRGSLQLGTLGSGNHFLEVQKVDKIFDEAAARAMEIEEDQVTVLIHCGSRGFGHQVCSDYLKISEKKIRDSGMKIVDRELACVPNNSDEGESYRKAMYSALNFAWSNRQMITHWTRNTFEKVMGMTEDEVDMKLVYDVSHNIAKVERHAVDGEGTRDLVVHRKGATRAFPAGDSHIPDKYRKIGQPVFIPGSMGTASWILLGNTKSLELSFGSTAHGAGRTMSRTAARRNYTTDSVRKNLELKGVYIKALSREGMVEETPEAYKDVDSVVEVSHSLGIATKVARLVPIGVIKG